MGYLDECLRGDVRMQLWLINQKNVQNIKSFTILYFTQKSFNAFLQIVNLKVRMHIINLIESFLTFYDYEIFSFVCTKIGFLYRVTKEK